MKTLESTAFRVSREAYERKFLNAESNYDRYLVFKQLISWIEDLTELNDLKDARIAELQKAVKGYDLTEYE